MRRPPGVALVAVLLTGCVSSTVAVARSGACLAPLAPATVTTLVFGRGMPDGRVVAEEDWRRFVDEVVTPAFPQGFTVTDGAGHWRDAGTVVREPSKVVMRVSDDGGPGASRAVERVILAYEERFAQKSVLRMDAPVCAGFYAR